MDIFKTYTMKPLTSIVNHKNTVPNSQYTTKKQHSRFHLWRPLDEGCSLLPLILDKTEKAVSINVKHVKVSDARVHPKFDNTVVLD